MVPVTNTSKQDKAKKNGSTKYKSRKDCKSKVTPCGWMARIRASLSLKLISIFVGGSFILTLLLGGLSQFGLKRHILETVQPLLTHYLHLVSEEIGNPPEIERAQAIVDHWPITIRIFNETEQWASDHHPHEPRNSYKRWRDRKGGAKRLQFYWDRGAVFLRKDTTNSRVYYGLQLHSFGPALFPGLFFGLVLIGLYGFYYSIRWLFQPIRTIQSGISQIGSGQLEHRIKICRTDELGQLADDVNLMADELGQMMQGKRDLLLALSHELKSPLARSRVTVELLDDSPYKQTLIDDQNTIQKLIDEVISAERSYVGHAVIHRSSIKINSLVDQVISSFEEDAHIEVLPCQTDILCEVDIPQLTRLLRNLLENALHYNRDQLGPVRFECNTTEKQLELIVSDHGLGIEPEHLKRLTEPFYRADPSRERKSGGLGLGLYLCQAVVDAHHGQMNIRSEVGVGTEVSCIIPF